ncbi:MAG: Rab family GTPase [Pyrinomonadaceae bacterium]
MTKKFSDRYHTTIGVKVDKKIVTVGDEQVNLLIWDLYGEDDLQKVQTFALRGASGYLLVVDGTRRYTLDDAQHLRKRAESVAGDVPFILAFNKSDLIEKWDFPPGAEEHLASEGWNVFKTSAKTGVGVEDAFHTLASKMIEKK